MLHVSGSGRKQRRTYSLDPELVNYVEIVRKERKAGSASSALEEILRESKRQRERHRIEMAISNYYSGLTTGEQEEERAWGEFAELQLPEE
jgi:hypothetical protein